MVVTGATGLVGRTLIPLLAGAGGQVRAVIRDRAAADALRRAGAKVAVCRLTDTETLASAMSGAHTVCHLAGGLDLPDARAYQESNLETTVATLEAAAQANVTRFLLLSYPGASPDASNAYLRAKGRAEAAVRESSLQHLILRSTHIYGPGSRWLAGMRDAARRPVAATVVGPGTQRLAPVFVDDVARALAAADDRAAPVEGTFAIQGPDVLSADALTDLLAGRRRRKVHLRPGAARTAARLFMGHMSLTLLEVLAAESVADAADAAREFGLTLTGLEDGLARS